MLVRTPSLTVFADYAKYVSNATVLSSSSIEFFLCSNYFQLPFISSFKIFLYTIRRSLVMEVSKTVSKTFSHSFCALRKVRFQCYCAQFKFNRIVLVLKLLSMAFYIIVKLWLRYHSQKRRYGGLKNSFEDLFSQFLRITQSTFPMLLCSVQVQSYCSCAQTTFNDLLYHR